MTPASKLRVLVVDDSLFMRGAVKKILDEDGRFEVVGDASDGIAAIEKVEKCRPDVVTMDFNMPLMNGVEAVRRIMSSSPVPIVMLSAHTTQGARQTMEALEAGAMDFLTKPSGEVSADLSQVGPELIEKLWAAAHADTSKLPSSWSRPEKVAARPAPRPEPAPGRRIVVIGVSTGGPAALAQFLPDFPRRTHLALVVVQHMPPAFTTALAERLDSISRMKVKEAKDGDRPAEGTALVAPGGLHLEFSSDGSVLLRKTPPVNGCRPSADVTMKSAAGVFSRHVIGVIMTGMGRDGAEGMAAIKSAGGRTLAQDKESCVVFGMPKACIDTGVVDAITPLDALTEALLNI